MSEIEDPENDVSVEVEEIETRSFIGDETVTTVITLVASGVAGGVASAIGESVWSGVKRLVGKVRRDDSSPKRIVVVAIVRTPDGETRYTCEVADEEGVAAFVRSLQAPDAPQLSGERQIAWKYDVEDSRWRHG